MHRYIKLRYHQVRLPQYIKIKMSEYKLTYFNLKGLGESIRYLLSYLGKEFKDERLEMSDWPALKSSAPFGKMPLLEIDGKVYHQSTALCRYLAVEAGLVGDTPIENLEIDQIGGTIMDIVPEVAKLWRLEGQEKEDAIHKVATEVVPYYMEKFEQRMKENNGYLANGKVSWADILLVSFSETLFPMLKITDHFEKYPHFKVLVDKVQGLPGIKEWIEKRPVTAL